MARDFRLLADSSPSAWQQADRVLAPLFVGGDDYSPAQGART